MRLALLLLLAAPASAQTLLDSLVSADRPYGTVYAPTPDALAESLEEVALAAAQFERSFGAPPPPITVVVVDDPAAIARIGMAALRARGRLVLPFVTRGGMAAAGSAALVGGAVVMERGGAVKVVGTTPGAALAVQTGDAILRVDGAPVTSAADFERRAASVAVGQTATVRVQRGSTEVDVPLAGTRTDEVAPRRAVSAGSARPLSHEAGHLFLLAHVAATGSTTEEPGAEYGSAALPDWIDEAFATLCEAPALVRARDAEMAEHLDAPIPLARFLTMTHPVVASGVLAGLRSDSTRAAGPRVLRVRADSGALGEASLFYAQASSFARFLAATRGDRLFGRVVDRVIAGATAAEALRAEGTDPDAVVPEWQAWVRKTAA